MEDVPVEPIGRRPRPVSRGKQILDYAFWLLYLLLTVRLLLIFVDARTWVGFARFITAVTDPFYAPFRGILPSTEVGDTGMVLAVPLLVALVAYALLQLAIHRLLELMAYRRTSV